MPLLLLLLLLPLLLLMERQPETDLLAGDAAGARTRCRRSKGSALVCVALIMKRLVRNSSESPQTIWVKAQLSSDYSVLLSTCVLVNIVIYGCVTAPPNFAKFPRELRHLLHDIYYAFSRIKT